MRNRKLASVLTFVYIAIMENIAFKAMAQKIYGKSGWQKQLAQDLGISHVTVSRYSTGKSAIPTTVRLAMERLASA